MTLEEVPVSDTADILTLQPTKKRESITERREKLRQNDKLTCIPAVKHEIPTRTNSAPMNVRPYRLPEKHKEEINQQINKMLEDGIIRPNFRKFNYLTIGDSFLLPNIAEIHDKLEKCSKKNVITVEKSGKKRQTKSLGGKGKLTAKLIDKLTVYYGLAIRRNCDSVENMYNAIWSTYYHYCSTDENPQHEKCPNGPESWCSWQRAVAANKLAAFKHDYQPFPQDVIEALHPIYTDLSNKKLLERCVGGFTQNSNESYNQLIWKITPKIIPAGSRIVEMAAYIAAGIFNKGTAALLYYMHAIGLSLGPNAHSYAEKEDAERVTIADRRAQENTREGRMVRRQQQNELLEAAERSESLLYGPGIDDSM
ncbi:uncharacterized protein LOC143894388 [Temnothorax americanus]|uniref:uncharacterized protein LOC143894388 n=1 Tax=Temnothorax americanus TaxID=1964332 RepID=UPI004067ECFC